MRETLVCWGYYRNPNSSDLFEIKARWSQSLSDPVDPHRPVEALGETQYERDVASQMANGAQKRKEEARLRAKEMLSVYQASEVGQLQAAMLQRYCVTAPGKQIHHVVERTQEKINADRP
jgi:hypothetical protein